jgi:hypothetical protein
MIGCSPSSLVSYSIKRIPFFLLAFLYITIFPHIIIAQDTNFWCYPIRLSTDVFSDPNKAVVLNQPVWWNEYYVIDVPANVSMEWKVYPARPNDIYTALYVRGSDCPQPQTSWYDQISFGSNQVITMQIKTGQPVTLIFMVRMIGCNYTLVGGLSGYTPNLCPQDCSRRGFCDTLTHKCKCNEGYEGDACETVIPPPTIPMGSWVKFYIVVVGVPVMGVALIGGLITAVYLHMHKRKRVPRRKYAPLPVAAQSAAHSSPYEVVQSR